MDLIKNIYSECFNPQKVKIYDGIKQTYEERYVPCGKCYHCRITKVNEWTTRMLLQSMASVHTYFCTLTYAENAPFEILDECDSVVHNINSFGKMQTSPLVLNKTHLQKFFKRLRKNTGKTLQYFACGEYGTNYCRPHYHFILWSDYEFNKREIEKAWSLDETSIGNVDFQDMNAEAINITHSFKYVCKYLQKGEFEFEKLKTYKYHLQNCITNYLGVNPDFKIFNEYDPTTIYPDKETGKILTYDEFLDSVYEKAMYIYKKKYSPFFLCSKKPAIGYGYFEANKTRFQKQDFRIPELQKGSIFPTYYVRKTKESICPYKTISVENGKPNTYSNIPNVVSLLVDLQNCISFNEGFAVHNKTYEYSCDFSSGQYRVIFSSPKQVDDINLPKKYFDFYDCKNHFTYSLAPDFMYNVVDSRKNLIYRVPISVVIQEIKKTYDLLLEEFLLPMFYLSEYNRDSKKQAVINEFGNYENYLEQKRTCTRNLLNIIKENQKRYNKRKNLF